MTPLRQVLHQFRYDFKSFVRNPAAIGFSVVLPIVFLILFVAIFKNNTVKLGTGRTINGSTYYVAAILALGIMSATFVNLAITMTVSRERGILKRLRSTPLAPGVFLASRILVSCTMALVLTVTLGGIGRLLYGVELPTNTLPGVFLTVLFGAVACSALGLALSSLIPSEDAGPPIANFIVLPLYFISGVFVADVPSGLTRVASLFPVRHLLLALREAWDPNTIGTGINATHLAVLAAWGAFGLVAGTYGFRWVPKSGN